MPWWREIQPSADSPAAEPRGENPVTVAEMPGLQLAAIRSPDEDLPNILGNYYFLNFLYQIFIIPNFK